MLKVVIENDQIVNEFTNDRGDTYRQQEARIFLPGSQFPDLIRFTVDAPFAKGTYQLQIENCLKIFRNKLQLGRLELTPVAAASKAAAN